MFEPRRLEDGRICCSSATALCASCEGHHRRRDLQSYAPPKTYATPTTAPMSARERERLGSYADAVQKMRDKC